MGGSQGAKIFGDIVSKAISMFDEKAKKRFFIYQQVVAEDIEKIKKFYKKIGVKAEIKAFFNNPAELLAKSSIFIGRSGASTVLEVGTVGRPAIFIPIMHKDRQQFINAEQITSVGGGEIIPQPEFSAKNLYKVLEKMVKNENLLENMAKKAKIFQVKNDASKNIAKLVDGIIKNKKGF
jgi:UDP-N-acetylglucosamine--N-acetylmuramyl-(pentapeptide) pyrophosphoryl-undecaprenol N-acetylglucosamine transferase